MRNVKKEIWRFAVVIVIGVMAVFALEQYSYAEDFAVTNTKEFRKALENAADNGEDDTITLAAGTYKPSDDGAGAFEFVDSETKKIKIKAKEGYEAKDVILDGEKLFRVLKITIKNTYGEQESPIEIENISIINGKTEKNESYGGGGIYTENQISLNKCILKGNNADEGDGGGVYVRSNKLIITDCILTDNSASDYGGGIYASSLLSINNSTVFKNKASLGGGGIYASNGILMQNSHIYENTAGQNGAGIRLSQSANSVIINSVISKNVITGTMGDGRGSGIYGYSELYLINCIISGNESDGDDSSAVYSGGIFINNIFLNNKENDINAPRSALVYNNYIDYAKIKQSGNDSITKKNNIQPSDGTPLFIDAYLRPASGSVIIDKGLDPTSIDFSKLFDDADELETITNALEFDKDGKPRIVGSTIDLGAYEFDPSAIPPVVTPTVERVAIDNTLSMTIPNIKCNGQLLNIGLNLEFYNNTSGLVIWKLKSSSASTIQPLSPISISTDYKISFSEFIYQNQTTTFPVVLEPYFNMADPFTLYWKLAM